ncbi:MAG: hypothetical protein PHV53_10630 [Fermentimonas sp.]|nr:hypothetical protein [Fermentimonas sp.]
MTFEELLLALEAHSDLISTETKAGHNTNVRVGLLGKKVAEILRRQGNTDEKYLSRLNDDSALGFIKFLAGAEFGEFISGMFGGKGVRIDKHGNIEATSLILRALLEVPELRYNRLTVIGDELILTENGLIESVEELAPGSFQLNMKLEEGDAITFIAGDLVKGIYHHAGGFATSFMRVEEVGQTFIKITLAADTDIPTPYNLAPQPFMNIARVGNVTNPNRQRYIVASSKLGGFQIFDGCSDFLNGRIVGSMDTAQSFKSQYANLPLRDGLYYMYAAGIVVQDIIRVDYQGKIIRAINDLGAWQAGVPYYNNDINGTDDVWHLGCRWRCFSDGTTEEPSWTSAAWYMIEGRSDARMEFEGFLGGATHFGALRSDFTDFTIKPIVLIGNTDVSSEIVEEQWRWVRSSGSSASDEIWNIEHSNNGRTLNISHLDMGVNWSRSNPVTFTCTATYPASVINEITNAVTI